MPPACTNPSVTVGSTSTGAPGTAASVYNSGTDCNAVLNFTIPAGLTGATGAPGATGPQGPQGPSGPAGAQGPAGAAATVTVGTTTTGAPGTNASVTNSGTPQNAILNFTIPAGNGSTGAYGGLYNSATQTVTPTTAGTYTQLLLNTAMPLSGITTATANTLTVTTAGNYEISYNISVTANESATLQVAVRSNGTVIPQTVTSHVLASNGLATPTYNAIFNTTVIAALAAGSVLDLAVAAIGTVPAGLSATIGAAGDASITVKKLS